MPCDTVTNYEVATHKMRREYFLDALKEMGYDNVREQGDSIVFGNNQSYNFKTGELKVREGTVNNYKIAYSQQVVKKQFAKMGWKPKQVAGGKYVYVKR